MDNDIEFRREAMFYEKEENIIHCYLCPHNCHIKDGGIGFCRVRKAEDGKLYSLNYGKVTSASLDPIEKKPLSRYKPGTSILSVGSFGCNLTCGFCQNHSISMGKPQYSYIPPMELLDMAERLKGDGNIGIAFTYNEPSIWYEYVYDVCKSGKDRDLDMVLVTNGYISHTPLVELLPFISAMNIDLKAFRNEFYKDTCSGDVKSVMSTIESASKACHVEVTTLLITDYNDSADEVEELSRWLSAVDPEIPLHLSRYFPRHKFTAPPTPIDTMYRAKEIADRYLKYVYLGNI